ncbi:Maff2 family mobile element protein [Helcococcus bovis]
MNKKKGIKMEAFRAGINVLGQIVIAIGGGLGIWGIINLLEGYGSDNPGAKSQGIKQLMGGGGLILLGIKVVPLLANLFG